MALEEKCHELDGSIVETVVRMGKINETSSQRISGLQKGTKGGVDQQLNLEPNTGYTKTKDEDGNLGRRNTKSFQRTSQTKISQTNALDQRFNCNQYR